MWDNVLLALQSLSTNKMRAVLTMLGIIIGIGAVIAIETVGGSLSGTITDSMSSFGASDITVSVVQKEEDDSNPFGITLRLFQSATPDEKSRITETMISEYREAFGDKIEAVKLTESVGTGTVSADDVTVSVSGWNDDAQSAEDLELLYGRLLSKGHKHTLRLDDCCQPEIECGGLLSKRQNEKLRLADCCHFHARLEDYSPGREEAWHQAKNT